MSEQDADDQNSDTLREELQRSRDEFPPHDSEDSSGPEHVADELRRLTEAHPQMTSSASTHESRGGATAPDSIWENHGPYAPQRLRRNRGRPASPDPLMFHSTIWMEHDQEASARAHEEPIEQLRDRVCTTEANLETLRTRLTQVADLRDAQGIREDHRALVARLTEVEECALVHTLREFMCKILRLESMLSGDDGGVIGEAIRACSRRLDNHRATMDDFYARMRKNEEIGLSTTRAENRHANAQNQSGLENRPPGRCRFRGQAPQRRFQRTMPRPSPPPAQGSDEPAALTPEMIQQASATIVCCIQLMCRSSCSNG